MLIKVMKHLKHANTAGVVLLPHHILNRNKCLTLYYGIIIFHIFAHRFFREKQKLGFGILHYLKKIISALLLNISILSDDIQKQAHCSFCKIYKRWSEDTTHTTTSAVQLMVIMEAA